MLVYHGSKNHFSTFDYGKIGTNGTSEGKGFYFTDNPKIASSYAQNGYLYTVKFNGQKSLSSTSRTITKEALKQFLIELNNETGYLSNWGDIPYDGLEKVATLAAHSEYEESDNDVDIIAGIANASGDMETSLSLTYKILGYDSIVLKPDWGHNQTIYIALTNDIIDIQTITPLL